MSNCGILIVLTLLILNRASMTFWVHAMSFGKCMTIQPCRLDFRTILMSDGRELCLSRLLFIPSNNTSSVVFLKQWVWTARVTLAARVEVLLAYHCQVVYSQVMPFYSCQSHHDLNWQQNSVFLANLLTQIGTGSKCVTTMVVHFLVRTAVTRMFESCG